MTENEISRLVVTCAIEVHRTLGGPGMLESVYEEALAWELPQSGLTVQRKVELPIPYKGIVLASPLQIDLIVGALVIVECKATVKISRSLRSADTHLFETDWNEARARRQFWRTIR
jgi:GxxExxY protein